MHIPVAIFLWKLLFGDAYKCLSPFYSYITEVREEKEGIRQDEWNMFFPFLQNYGNDLSSFDPLGKRWLSFIPVGPYSLLFCNFVEHQKSK